MSWDRLRAWGTSGRAPPQEVVCTPARGGFWLLEDELELREEGGRALQEDVCSMYVGSEAEHGVAFSGMEVHGGRAQGTGG